MKILFDPDPRTEDEIFSAADNRLFRESYEIVEVNAESRAEVYRRNLPSTHIAISQQPFGKTELMRAKRLRAIFNVETNFLQNVDYEECFRRGIHVLTPGSVFAVPVAEMALGMALSLARGIHTGHADFLVGSEQYGLDGNADAELLTGANVGIIGFGDLGRAVRRALLGFNANIRVYDPWLPSGILEREGVLPMDLGDLLADSRFVFVTASATSENKKFLGAREISKMQCKSMLILLSRAAVADFDALRDAADSGRIRVATDVYPEEPFPKIHPLRKAKGILFSAHRAGAVPSALTGIGRLVLEDMEMIARGLPPFSCRRAERETVGRLQSMPISRT
ncbi:MAG: hypothetical protein OXI87_23575 [Albidovulum sp.]|nr:hypothetical protein [Albidovulum sp.]